MSGTIDTSDLTSLGPAWAFGCEDCEYGILAAPAMKWGVESLYNIRRAQALSGTLIFCECKAGKAYRKFLLGDKAETTKPPTVNGKPIKQAAGASAANEAHRQPETATNESRRA